ncbi:ABC transporter ATP-binding protein [Paenibacillus crassostreae]|uniref:Multidrug ABC transporter n=1 Tax=Paenibacillus crassostreae TaxID=1763538 RepID=A0A167GCE1_9BACL|nr:ABC transporter ATP-binding protein [Paenibacillus crassostreae]AOZ92671.1 multidrug ABC transporter [Paenibacillus crassostreae]OAB77440.1 multidrug ABC transporter [Paenibacillus crassostreae]
MKDLFYFIRKMHHVAGFRLYINMSMTLLISLLDGIGIYLIVPLLSIIGVFDMSMDGVPLISSLLDIIESWSFELNLPIVLAVYVVIVGGEALLQRSQTLLNARILQNFIRTLRIETYRGLIQAKWEFFLRKRKSDFNHILTNELGRVNYGTSLFLQMITSIIFTIIQIGLALWLSPVLTIVVMISGGLIALYSRKFIKKSKNLGEQTTELSKYYFGGINDHFNGIKDIKSNRLEQSHIVWFKNLSTKMEHNFIQLGRVNSLSQLIYRLSSVVLIAGFVYLALEVIHTPVEQLIIVVLIFSRLWPRFISIQSSTEQLVSSFPAFQAMRNLQMEYETDKEIGEIASMREPDRLKMQEGIECRDVNYRYDSNEPVFALSDINIHIPANRMTAIVGKSGAGKSTLIDMLMGMIHPENGQVMIDGETLRDEQQLLSLRSSIGYVAQDPFLFNESIRDNLKLVNPNANDAELWEALSFSASEEFVRKLPRGLDTVIGDRGIRLSGGERQRIVLARAILKRPAILVLDEATSALDSENEQLIQGALELLKGSMTIIVIAHRLSTIRNADQVIVMEQGEVIQQGGYQQLSQETKGTFRQLLNYQTGTEM